MMKLTTLLLLATTLLTAQNFDRPRQFSRDTAYWSSVAFLASAQAADHVSSLNRRELNPLLQNSHGHYNSHRGAAAKIAVTAGIVALQHYDIKRNPQHRKVWMIANYVIAGSLSIVAVKNQRGGW